MIPLLRVNINDFKACGEITKEIVPFWMFPDIFRTEAQSVGMMTPVGRERTSTRFSRSESNDVDNAANVFFNEKMEYYLE